MTVEEVQALAGEIRAEVAKAVVGQEATVELMLVALFAGGHILLEGPPGTAKTLLAHSFARAVGLDFGRIQFTPDLMPGDIIGANLFNFQTSTFTLTRGPIFTELLLADEINRTPPKTQAALLEAMQERTVTIDGESPDAERPISWWSRPRIRSSSRASIPCPRPSSTASCSSRLSIIPPPRRNGRSSPPTAPARARWSRPTGASSARRTRPAIGAAMEAVAEVRLVDEVIDYIAGLIRGTRDVADLESGASPRAGAMLAGAARARAALDGRDFVIPDDVKTLAPALLRHRLILSPAAEINGRKVEEVVTGIIETIEAPR